MPAPSPVHRRRRIRWPAITIIVVVTVVLGGVDATFYFWPFRYGQVHPLLEEIFNSRVVVGRFHRTYFPHPGFVIENVTLYRHGDTSIPPLATIRRMTVIGTWANLFLHPHLLHEIRVEGLHVEAPPPGTKAHGTDFDGGVFSSSQQKIQVESIVADGTTLDAGRKDEPPLHFRFPVLQIHDLRRNQPLLFFARTAAPELGGTLTVDGRLGPFETSHYSATPLSGTYSLEGGDLQSLRGLSGHVAAGGRYSGTVNRLVVEGTAKAPDFRAGSGHAVAVDAAYRLTVEGAQGNVQIDRTQVKTGGSTIAASGSVTGSQKKVEVTIATQNSPIAPLLELVEAQPPQVVGRVSFQAHADFPVGPGSFLKHLSLEGHIAIDQVRFVSDGTQRKVDAFSARVRQDPVVNADAKDDPPPVRAAASGATRLQDGVAYFPDIRIMLPGAAAHLHGTFNLLNTRLHLTGQIAMERGLSHAVTGWKAVALAPLSPFFRHKHAGAVAPIAVIGTAQNPKITGDLLHDK